MAGVGYVQVAGAQPVREETPTVARALRKRDAMQPVHVSADQSWVKARERLRSKFSGLMEEDLVLVPGREENLLETVARRTGRSRQEVVDAFDALGMFRAS